MTVSTQDPGGLSKARGESLERPDGGPQAVGTIPEQTVNERDTVWFLAFPYFRGPKRELLEYRAACADDNIATVEVSGRSVTVAGVAPGTTTATITARDPASREASQQVPISVRRANRPPEAVGTILAQTVSVGEMVELDLAPYFTDPDGDPLQYVADVFFDNRAVVSIAGSLMSIAGLAKGHTWITVRASDPDREEARQRRRTKRRNMRARRPGGGRGKTVLQQQGDLATDQTTSVFDHRLLARRPVSHREHVRAGSVGTAAG